ncbi:four-carbon acid sugar kinase family protein [Enterococcus durans]|uniref:four-carbon acid sugar kinase family protein n=1 Tax=Enterococcus durans TaxID=53345 RepID=UPI0030CA5751
MQTLVSTETVVQYDALPQEIEVLVLNTESRHLTFEQAYEKTKKILEDAKVSQIPFIYKKVDSALRGNISAELKAILDTSEQAPVPFLPAYPEMNRVVIDGHLYIEDVLVSESVFAKDPYEPVTESNVMRRL